MAEPTTSQDSSGITAEGTSRGTTSGDAPAATATPIPSEQIGQYLLLEKLGEGGMGVVYKGLHAKLKKGVAVKVLAAQRSQFPDLVERLHLEMEAIGRLDQPNLVSATDA